MQHASLDSPGHQGQDGFTSACCCVCSTLQTVRPFGSGDPGSTCITRTVHTYVGVHTCGVACVHQPCAAGQIELLQGREVAKALRQLNLQADS